MNKLGENHPLHWSAKEEEETTIERSRRHKSRNAFFDCGCGSGHFINLTYYLWFFYREKPNKELMEQIDNSELDKNSWIEIHTCSPSREEKGKHFLTYGILLNIQNGMAFGENLVSFLVPFDFLLSVTGKYSP